MSHQTKYKSRFTNLAILGSVLTEMGFQHREHGQRHIFVKDGMPAVTVIQQQDGTLEISTDLHIYSSRALIVLIGEPANEYEPLATMYNQEQITQHFKELGHEVEAEVNSEGEVMLTVNVGNWN